MTVPDNNQTTVNTINTMMRDPAMRAVYAESLNDWQQFSQVFPGTIGNWAQYNDSGYGGQYGFWGQLEDSLQDPTITPRYQPLLDFTKNVLSVDATLPSAPAGFAAVASSTPGVVDLSWNPSTDNVGVRDYNVFRNGVDIGTTSQTTYEDTGLAYTTAYTYVVKALDTSANFSASSTPVTVTTTGPDLTAPTVGIYNPSSGAAVSGSSVTLVATSSDNVSVASVQFKVGNTDVGPLITVNSAANVIATSTTTGDFTGFTNGSYTLNAVSEDTSGNYATSSIPITIDNTNTPTFGLVGWWPLDASTTNWTTGTTLDESGTGANGSLINLSTTTAPISGSIGQALQLNMDNTGTTEYVNLATSSATKLNANFSISVWLNFASSTPCCQNIIDRGTMYGAAMYNLYFNYPGSSNPFPSLIFQVGDGSTTATLNIGVSPSITPLNKWNHLMCESDTSLMSCYIDGTLLGTTTRSAVSSSFSGTDNWFETGVSSNPNSFPFYGGVDDLRIYNRVLTQPEVLQLYDQGL